MGNIKRCVQVFADSGKNDLPIYLQPIYMVYISRSKLLYQEIVALVAEFVHFLPQILAIV